MQQMPFTLEAEHRNPNIFEDTFTSVSLGHGAHLLARSGDPKTRQTEMSRGPAIPKPL